MKRPNLFNWHMTQPDESVLVSDRKSYGSGPFVEQATATWLKMRPVIRRLCSLPVTSPATGSNFNIKQNGDEFVLTPKGSNGNLKQFTINVSSNGTINQFGAVEQDDQRVAISLSLSKTAL